MLNSLVNVSIQVGENSLINVSIQVEGANDLLAIEMQTMPARVLSIKDCSTTHLLLPKMVVILCVRECKSTASYKAFPDDFSPNYFLIIPGLFLDYSHMIPG